MSYYDVFNGDADGICALHQLRLDTPLDSMLITGVKRDVQLLEKIQDVRDSTITILDISLQTNRDALMRLLNGHNSIRYFDHHYAGDIPDGPDFDVYIDTSSNICTSILVDQYLKGRHRLWAIVGAFGDNLHNAAVELAQSMRLTPDQIRILRELGELINYNGYGNSPEDLHFPPAELYKAIVPFKEPFEFYHSSTILHLLREGFSKDMQNALSQPVIFQSLTGKAYRFPAEVWSKRIAGVFSNQVAREEPSLAHALLVDNGDGTLLISVRAPVDRPHGADTICRKFPTGGGRARAAGINRLPEADLNTFLTEFETVFAQA